MSYEKPSKAEVHMILDAWHRLHTENKELRASLRALLKLHSFEYLDKGIGTATPEGMTLLRARRLAEAESPQIGSAES